MSGTKHRQEKPSPEIEYSEIHIPDDKDLGTGTYTTVLKPNALASKKVIVSAMINAPVFQLTVSFNPGTKEIPVLLGKADNKPPLCQRIFTLSANLQLAESYVFVVNFRNWEIESMTMNNATLHQKTQPGTVNFWFDPAKNAGALTEGKTYRWGIFKVNGEECSIMSDGGTLYATLNRGTDREALVFSTEIDADPSQRHMVTVTWDDQEMKLYFDGECKTTVQVNL